MRAKISQRQITHIPKVTMYKARTDALKRVDVVNEFVRRNDNRQRSSDLHLSFNEADLVIYLNIPNY